MSETDTTEAPVTFEKGTWQHNLNESGNLRDRAGKANKRAGVLLWNGAKAGIEEWFPNSATDTSAEAFQQSVLVALGASRKGDASKIKTVALAVRNHALILDEYPNLSKAYAKALDLTKGAKEREVEDSAADDVIEALEPPKTTSSVDGAALILLSKGLDGAVVAILDALNAGVTDEKGEKVNNTDAHRAFMRAVSTEIASRVQAKAKAESDAKRAAQAAAKPKPAKKAAAKKAAAPAPASTKAKPKGKPVGTAKKAAAPKVEEVPDDLTGAGSDDLDEMLDEMEGTEAPASETPEVKPVKKVAAGRRGKPVQRPAR